MTAEEMAKEYAENNAYHYANDYLTCQEAHLAGLKAGSQLDMVWQDYDAGEGCYEDSHEGRWIKREDGKPQWHDLRKNPDDLPAEGEIVLCYCLGYCGASYPITARMYNNYEDSSIHYWWTLGGEGKSEELSNVLAWKEIEIIPRGIMNEKETD